MDKTQEKWKRYQKAVVDLYHWQYDDRLPGGEPFSSMLFCLLRKADPDNYDRLKLAFPEETQAIEDWTEAGDYGRDLFREHNLMD